MKGLQHLGVGFTVEVHLVQDNGRRDVIDLASDQDPVQKREFDFRGIDGADYEGSVQVGSYDVGLSGKVCGLADYVVSAREDGCYHRLASIFNLVAYPVSDCNRVSRRAALQPYLASEDSRKEVPFGDSGEKVVASRMFDYCCFAFLYHIPIFPYEVAKILYFLKIPYLCAFVPVIDFIMITQQQIEASLKAMFEDLTFRQEPEGLYDPLRYMIKIGGKRVRPRLCLTAFSLFKDEFTQEILSPAAALEVFHSFTLIHDDIMDKADVRRGVPTVYKKWDENTAILSGDVMSIESYRLIAKAPAKALPKVLELFSVTAAQVCEGQQYDMDFENLEQVEMEDYMKMVGLKTAVLIACSAKMGALIADAPQQACDLLYDYGYDLGLAFQIADDWLDTYADPDVFGKAIGGDILNNKKTWLLTRAFLKSDEGTRARLLEAMALPTDTSHQKEAKIAEVKRIYEELQVGKDALDEIVRLHTRALNHVSALNLSPERFALLRDYANHLVGRTK